MNVDGEEEEVPTRELTLAMHHSHWQCHTLLQESDTLIEAPSSLLLPSHDCDIAGIEVGCSFCSCSSDPILRL